MINDPLAGAMMRSIVMLHESRQHFYLHTRSWFDPECASDCEGWRGVVRNEFQVAFHENLALQLTFAFCQRFQVSQGYAKRFYHRVWLAELRHAQAMELADTFTADHRDALQAWLTTQPLIRRSLSPDFDLVTEAEAAAHDAVAAIVAEADHAVASADEEASQWKQALKAIRQGLHEREMEYRTVLRSYVETSVWGAAFGVAFEYVEGGRPDDDEEAVAS
ncbi:MAG: hypothetical protein AB7R89_11150 [Dehalococcoidia bacterium]